MAIKAPTQDITDQISNLCKPRHEHRQNRGVQECVHQILAQKQRSVHLQCPPTPLKVSMGRPHILLYYYNYYYCSYYNITNKLLQRFTSSKNLFIKFFCKGKLL
jgi:hypothetical protein